MRNSMRRSAAAGVALHHRVLDFDRAAQCVDHAAEFDERAVAGALHHAPTVNGDSGVDQVAAQRPQSRENTVFVSPREARIADDIGSEYRRKLTGFAHVASTLAKS